MKKLVGQHNPSLQKNLVFEEYKDKSTTAILRQFFPIVLLTCAIMVSFIQGISISITSPFYSIVTFIKEYRSLIMIGLLLINSLLQQLQDGAFEMYVNDKLVYSKLATGRYPTEEELISIITGKKEE